MPKNNKRTQVDKATIILDERIANVFYRVILVCSLLLAMIGLESFEPMPPIFGLGVAIMGLLGFFVCLHHINKTRAVIRALEI